MSQAFLQSTSIVFGVALVVVVFVGIWIFRSKAVIRKQLNHQRAHMRQSDLEVQKLNKQLLEIRSVVVGLGQRVTEQQDIIKHLSERIHELEHADSDGRLYSRATKMVQLGADINELIEECELPKAEAELMLSLQKKLAGYEQIPSLTDSPEPRRAGGRRQKM